VQNRERKANEPITQQILDILNFRPPKTRRRLYGDRRTRMDYETLSECSEELVELMDSWVESGCRLGRWPPMLQFEDDLNRRKLFLHARGDGRVGFGFTPPIREKGDLGLGGGFQIDARPGRTAAVALFFQFITGPFQKDIHRCKRCRKFYWNRSGRKDKVYCRPRCASADTATVRTRERRIKERQDKLRAVQRAIEKLNRLSTDRRSRLQSTWKSWVAKEAGLGVTPNFITRAIHAGEIKGPRLVGT
jgi:hypothetical protein